MSIVLDHAIVAVADSHRGARVLADLLGLAVSPRTGPFIPLQINSDLTLDFDDRQGARPGHYAFLVDESTFDGALSGAKSLGLAWGSAPRITDFRIIRLNNGRGVYVRDPDGIAYEFLTRAPDPSALQDPFGH
jgi:hypothetical protein